MHPWTAPNFQQNPTGARDEQTTDQRQAVSQQSPGAAVAFSVGARNAVEKSADVATVLHAARVQPHQAFSRRRGARYIRYRLSAKE